MVPAGDVRVAWQASCGAYYFPAGADELVMLAVGGWQPTTHYCEHFDKLSANCKL